MPSQGLLLFLERIQPGWRVAAVWFVYHHFWFLDIAIGGVPLQVLCQLLLVALIPAALLPGLIATGAHKDFINHQMLIQVPLRPSWHSAAPSPARAGSLCRTRARQVQRAMCLPCKAERTIRRAEGAVLQHAVRQCPPPLLALIAEGMRLRIASWLSGNDVA